MQEFCNLLPQHLQKVQNVGQAVSPVERIQAAYLTVTIASVRSEVAGGAVGDSERDFKRPVVCSPVVASTRPSD